MWSVSRFADCDGNSDHWYVSDLYIDGFSCKLIQLLSCYVRPECHGLYWNQATALVVTYPVINAVSEDGNAAPVAWEQEFIRLVKVLVVCFFVGCEIDLCGLLTDERELLLQ